MPQALATLKTLIEEHLAAERSDPVRALQTPEQLRAKFELALPEEGIPFEELSERLRGIMAATPATASDLFFNQLYGGRDPAAFTGDVISAVLNTSMYTYKIGGVQVLIELALVKRMGQMMGFPDAEGVFTPGGSLSNLAGMVVALNQAIPGYKDHGAQGKQPRIYTSIEGHYSVPKAAGLLGVGQSNVVKIPVDGRGQMLPESLESAIVSDIEAGFTPAMINATSGTTVLGAFDPIAAISAIAKRHNVWLHVDAAYGGTFVFHPELKAHFADVGLADSVTWDAHKVMSTPLTCSVILVKEKGLMTQAMSQSASYLFQGGEDEFNPGTRSIQCGRRNSALKLWCAWQVNGDAGYLAKTQSVRNNALTAQRCIEAAPELSLVRVPESINICFDAPGVDTDALLDAVCESGQGMIGHAQVDGRTVVRLVFLNSDVRTEVVERLFVAIQAQARALAIAPAA